LSTFVQFATAQSNGKTGGNPVSTLMSLPNSEIIVKFLPQFIDEDVVNNEEKQQGELQDFLAPKVVEFLKNNPEFGEGYIHLKTRKIFSRMKTTDTISISRSGREVRIPKFWSAFVIEWNSELGYSYKEVIDFLNTKEDFIEYAHPNYKMQQDALPNDAEFEKGTQQSLFSKLPPQTNPSINVEPAWDFATGVSSVRVGVIDDGINFLHEDMVDDPKMPSLQNSVVKGGRDYCTKVMLGDPKFKIDKHGSNVAGIIGAFRNNTLGVAGIAGGDNIDDPGISLFSLAIKDNNGNLDMALAADAMFDGASSLPKGFGLNIMNTSFSIQALSSTKKAIRLLQDQTIYAYNNGVAISASSGNSGTGLLQYPASFQDEWVFKVGGNNFDNDWEKTSNHTDDFVAPSEPIPGFVTTIGLNNTYNTFGGTSSAAPHVTGVAALLMSYTSSPLLNLLAPEDIEQLLERFAYDIHTTGIDPETGHGKIDAGATMRGIAFPKYRVRHFNRPINKNNATLTKQNTNTNITVSTTILNVAAGAYNGDIYEVVEKVPINPNGDLIIIDTWLRSSGASPIDLFTGAQSQISVTFDQKFATVKARVFHIKTNSLGQTIDQWIPSGGLLGKENLAFTVYSEKNKAFVTTEEQIDENHLRVVPNPNDGNMKVLFNLPVDGNLSIEIFDLNGRKVFATNNLIESAGHKEIPLAVTDLTNGLYIVKIQSQNQIITKKITILK
jgi:subtilisin family serine protease